MENIYPTPGRINFPLREFGQIANILGATQISDEIWDDLEEQLIQADLGLETTDAVLDAFTDSDFHLGGTDTKGYILGGSFGIDKNTWFTMRWLSADPIDGPPLSIDVLQADLNARF